MSNEPVILFEESQPTEIQPTLAERVAAEITRQSEERELAAAAAVGSDAPMGERIAAKIKLMQMGYE